jgi:hypothetical protein
MALTRLQDDRMTQPLPPRYFWLWHLAALKVIDADFGPAPVVVPPVSDSALRAVADPAIKGTVWDRIAGLGAGSATVALIDTGVSRAHPNLSSRVDERSIDLTSHRYGAQTLPIGPGTTPATREGRKAFFAGLSLKGLHPLQLEADETEFLEAMVEEYKASQGVTRQMLDAEETFATHGTACAGLIVGEPAVVKEPGATEPQPPEIVLTGSAINPNANLLPYFGVDPFSRLMSIKTSFESDPYQFIAAFLYAWQHRVDAIVLPRGLPDPRRGRLLPKEELKADLETWESRHAADLFHRLNSVAPDPADSNAAQDGFQPDRPWKILRHLILAISRHIPVICAAGNDGESQLIYPANLADDSNGIIAVGAVTAEGLRSGYSNYGEGLTLVAPSDDYEVYNRHQSRLDTSDPLLKMHDYSVGAGQAHVFCPLDLVSTDLPGVFGFDAGAAPWSSVLPGQGNPGVGGGYYTAFGGTSGASCLIGGLALLAQRARRAAGKAPLDGLALKSVLVAGAVQTAAVAPGWRPLTADRMNADDEPHLGLTHFFGAGLPDAGAVVNEALALP